MIWPVCPETQHYVDCVANYSDDVAIIKLLFIYMIGVRLCLGYLGELCAVHRDDRPTIVRGINRVCAVRKMQTCEEVHVDATDFAVNPLFSCRVVVSTGSLR